MCQNKQIVNKNYRQTHRMDYMLFASVLLSKVPSEGKILVFNKMCHKTKMPLKIVIFVVNFEKNCSRILGAPTDGFRSWWALSKDPSRSKIGLVIGNLSKFSIFLVFLVVPSTSRGYPQRQKITLSNDTLGSKIRLLIEKLFKLQELC